MTQPQPQAQSTADGKTATTTTLEDVLASVRAYVKNNHPRVHPQRIRLRVDLSNGQKIRLDLPQDPPASDHTLSPDGRTLVWYGTTYAFTPGQAAVVQVLYRALLSGVPAVSAQAALEEAGSEAASIRDVFRTSAAWADGVVAPADRGMVRLVPPHEII